MADTANEFCKAQPQLLAELELFEKPAMTMVADTRYRYAIAKLHRSHQLPVLKCKSPVGEERHAFWMGSDLTKSSPGIYHSGSKQPHKAAFARSSCWSEP